MKKFIMEMENGDVMRGELYPEIAPITVENFVTHTDVFQVVQFTEYTHLAEFADSRNKKEAQILSQTFKRTEKLSHFVAELLLKRNI